jgi:hypothetical protein
MGKVVLLILGVFILALWWEELGLIFLFSVGGSIFIAYVILLYTRVAKGFHLQGSPIAPEKYKAIKEAYYSGAIILFLLVIGGPFFIMERKAVSDAQIERLISRMTFEEFKTAYNKNASEIIDEPIHDWSMSSGEKANTAGFSGEGYSFLISVSKDPSHHVTAVMFIFEATQCDRAMWNILRMACLVLTIEQNMPTDEAGPFVTQLMGGLPDGVKKQGPKSNASYRIQAVAGNIVMSIIIENS